MCAVAIDDLNEGKNKHTHNFIRYSLPTRRCCCFFLLLILHFWFHEFELTKSEKQNVFKILCVCVCARETFSLDFYFFICQSFQNYFTVCQCLYDVDGIRWKKKKNGSKINKHCTKFPLCRTVRLAVRSTLLESNMKFHLSTFTNSY